MSEQKLPNAASLAAPRRIVPEMTRERRRERRVPTLTKGLQMRAPEDFNEATTV